jgi:hypothetical protein
LFLHPLPNLPPSLSRSFSEAKHGGRSRKQSLSPLGETGKGVNYKEMEVFDFDNIKNNINSMI